MINKEKVVQFLLIIFLISLSLPIELKYSSFALIALLIGLSLFFNVRDFKSSISNWYVILCFLFFISSFIRNVIVGDTNNSNFQDVKLSFAILPIVALSSSGFISRNMKLILRSFISGVLIYVLYAWFFAFHFYFVKYPEFYSFSLTDGYLRYMLYNYLPGAFHHTYIGLYITFAILFVKKAFPKRKILSKIIMVFLIFSLFFIGSKLTFFLAIVFVLYFIIQIKITKKYKIILSTLLLLLAFSSFMIVNNALWISASITNSIETRLEIYRCGLDGLISNFVFGVGHSNFDLLVTNYCPNFNLFDKFIPHNIFIRETLANGLIGFIILVSLILYLMYISLKSKDLLFVMLTITLVIVGSVEDIIYQQRGVLFFAFFLSVFYIRSKQESSKTNDNYEM